MVGYRGRLPPGEVLSNFAGTLTVPGARNIRMKTAKASTAIRAHPVEMAGLSTVITQLSAVRCTPYIRLAKCTLVRMLSAPDSRLAARTNGAISVRIRRRRHWRGDTRSNTRAGSLQSLSVCGGVERGRLQI